MISSNGLPMYSVAFVTIRHEPLSTAIVKPVAASGTVGAAIAASGARANAPSSRRSSTSTLPNSVATPRIWIRFATP